MGWSQIIFGNSKVYASIGGSWGKVLPKVWGCREPKSVASVIWSRLSVSLLISHWFMHWRQKIGETHIYSCILWHPAVAFLFLSSHIFTLSTAATFTF